MLAFMVLVINLEILMFLLGLISNFWEINLLGFILGIKALGLYILIYFSLCNNWRYTK